jgi:hypothetical protein
MLRAFWDQVVWLRGGVAYTGASQYPHLVTDNFGVSCWRKFPRSVGLWHYGPELQESAEDKAERLIAEQL